MQTLNQQGFFFFKWLASSSIVPINLKDFNIYNRNSYPGLQSPSWPVSFVTPPISSSAAPVCNFIQYLYHLHIHHDQYFHLKCVFVSLTKRNKHNGYFVFYSCPIFVWQRLQTQARTTGPFSVYWYRHLQQLIPMKI